MKYAFWLWNGYVAFDIHDGFSSRDEAIKRAAEFALSHAGAWWGSRTWPSSADIEEQLREHNVFVLGSTTTTLVVGLPGEASCTTNLQDTLTGKPLDPGKAKWFTYIDNPLGYSGFRVFQGYANEDNLVRCELHGGMVPKVLSKKLPSGDIACQGCYRQSMDEVWEHIKPVSAEPNPMSKFDFGVEFEGHWENGRYENEPDDYHDWVLHSRPRKIAPVGWRCEDDGSLVTNTSECEYSEWDGECYNSDGDPCDCDAGYMFGAELISPKTRSPNEVLGVIRAVIDECEYIEREEAGMHVHITAPVGTFDNMVQIENVLFMLDPSRKYNTYSRARKGTPANRHARTGIHLVEELGGVEHVEVRAFPSVWGLTRHVIALGLVLGIAEYTKSNDTKLSLPTVQDEVHTLVHNLGWRKGGSWLGLWYDPRAEVSKRRVKVEWMTRGTEYSNEFTLPSEEDLVSLLTGLLGNQYEREVE